MGTVIRVQPPGNLEMNVEKKGVATNVYVTVANRDGANHEGALFVPQPS